MEETTLVTQLLQRMQAGEDDAANKLYPILYRELRGMARKQMANQRADHTLGTTGLMHEAFVRLAGAGGDYEGRKHFLRVASRAMRSVLVDHARGKNAQKRGGSHERVPLDDVLASYEERAVDLIALDEALEKLGEVDEQLRAIVDMRFFGGLENAAIADALGVSTRTVERGWKTAHAWLSAAMGEMSDS